MRTLVTGACGFVGRHLVRELAANGHEVLAADRVAWPAGDAAARGVELDVLDRAAVRALALRERPDCCVHLAAIALVPLSWSDPEQVFRVNVLGTINILEAMREAAPAARVLILSSAEVYGTAPRNGKISEEEPFRPETLYGVSKAAADMAALVHARKHGTHTMVARPCNHTGPGQTQDFAVPAFAAQIAAAARGDADGVIRVGNLDSTRDLMDVRDVVHAYRLLLEKGAPARAYNLSAGRQRTMREVLERLAAIAGITPRIEVDPVRFRPADSRPVLDTTRIRTEIGWSPRIPIDQTLSDMLASFN